MKYLICLFVLSISQIMGAQTIIDFEKFDLDPESFLNGNDLSGGFESDPLFLNNTYNSNYDFWSGWAISNTTDVTTAGFGNQYSSASGAGKDGSANYAVAYDLGDAKIKLAEGLDARTIKSISINNGTYAYLSMLEGDSFAKKFGGATGDDPDWFKVNIKKYENGSPAGDGIDFFLADFTFNDNAQDYIVNEWTEVDLSALGQVDSLILTLSSSDVGQFGMNTPAYFCVDDIVVADPVSNDNLEEVSSIKVFPNPANDYLILEGLSGQFLTASIFDNAGSKVLELDNVKNERLDISLLKEGFYLLVVQEQNGKTSQKSFIKTN